MFWNRKQKKAKEYLLVAVKEQGEPTLLCASEIPINVDEPFVMVVKGSAFNQTVICSIRDLLEKFEQIIFFYDDSYTRTFYKEDIQDVVTEDLNKNNLLEIKLKDTDSVPEVYYKGQRMDEPPKGLVDIAYHYHTTGDGSDMPDGANDISVEYYDIPVASKHVDRKIIGHKRDI